MPKESGEEVTVLREGMEQGGSSKSEAAKSSKSGEGELRAP